MGEGEKGEKGCIPKQQNLSRAMRDWDLMHEEGATLSTMCNTLRTPHSATRYYTPPSHPSYTLIHTPCTHTLNETAAVYRAWIGGYSHTC